MRDLNLRILASFLIIFLIIASENILNVYCNDELSENFTKLESIYVSEFLKNESENDFEAFNRSIDKIYIINETEFENKTENISEPNIARSVTEDSDIGFQNELLYRKYPGFHASDEDICSCDLSFNACDINCCCDSDCSEEDIRVFSKCHSQIMTPDKNYCYQKDIIFRNNTVFKMQVDPESALFCIVHDNFKEHLFFKDIPVLKSHRELNLLLKYQYKTIFSWDVVDNKQKPEWSGMQAGSPIYIDINSEQHKTTETHWRLPSSCLSKVCSCQQEVRYLEDVETSCTRIINNLSVECETNKMFSGDEHASFCVSSRSSSTDIRSNIAELILHTMETNISSVADDEYSSDMKGICVEKARRRPTMNGELCENVVKSIHFSVEHDGINGIRRISTHFDYIFLSLNEKAFTQYFSVNFSWSNVTDVVKKSGNPGYQVGLPILAGSNDTNVDSDDVSLTVHNGGLTVLGRDGSGMCNGDRRKVLFGKNLKTGCRLRSNAPNCKILRERILTMLLGPSRKEIFIGIFGNANISNPDDWIEAYHEEYETSYSDEKCFSSLGLRIDIAYTAVGTIANPQYKIIGVGYHYMKPEYVEFSCSTICPDIILTSSVSFFDVTEPAVPQYPKVPSIKASLPSDFFYPFIYGKGADLNCNALYIVLTFLLLILVM